MKVPPVFIGMGVVSSAIFLLHRFGCFVYVVLRFTPDQPGEQAPPLLQWIGYLLLGAAGALATLIVGALCYQASHSIGSAILGLTDDDVMDKNPGEDQ